MQKNHILTKSALAIPLMGTLACEYCACTHGLKAFLICKPNQKHSEDSADAVSLTHKQQTHIQMAYSRK